MEKSVEQAVVQSLASIDQRLRLMDASLVLIRSCVFELSQQVAKGQIDGIHERIDAAHAEFGVTNGKREDFEHVQGGRLFFGKLLDLGAELSDLQLAARVMFPETVQLSPEAAAMLAQRQKLGGEFIERRFDHADSVAR